MSKKLTMAIIAVLLVVVVIGVAVYYVSSNNDSEDGHTLSFESNGGSDVPPITFDENSPVVAPPNPTKTGSEFLGWYSDESLTAPFTFNELPPNDAKLFAKWAEMMDIDDDDWDEIKNNPSVTIWNISSSQTDSIAVSGSDIIKMEEYLEEIMLTVPNGCIVLDLEDMRENNHITNNSIFKFSIAEGNKAALSSEESDIIGDRPFYNVIFTLDDKNISDPDDFITLYLNYTLKDGENASRLQVYSLSNSGFTETVDTDYIAEENLVECDTEYSAYYIIACDGLLWPDMFGIDIPQASDKVEQYIGTSLFKLIGSESSEDLPPELMKYIDISKINWELRSVSIDDYSKSQFDDYIKSLRSDGFENYPFSEDVSAGIYSWIGIKSVGGVNYLMVVSLNEMDLESYDEDEPSLLYQLDDSDLTIVMLNFDPLKELGVSVTKSESSSDNSVNNLVGFTIPAPYANCGFESLTEMEFSGSSLSALLDKIIITDNMSSEERKGLESFLNGLSNIECRIGYINTIDETSRLLTYDAIQQEINAIKDQNGLKLISATIDDGHYESPVVLAKTLKAVNGTLTFEDLVIISFNGIEDDGNLLGYNPEMDIFVVDASFSIDLNSISIPGFELNNLMFNEPWIENFAGFQFPEPYQDAIIDYCIDINVNISELSNLLNAAFPDPSLVPEDILIFEEIMSMYKDLSGDIGIISFTSPDFGFEAAEQFVQKLAAVNGLNILPSEDDDFDDLDDAYSWTMAKKLLVASQTSIDVEDLITVTWIPYDLDGKNMYSVQITSMDAEFTISL